MSYDKQRYATDPEYREQILRKKREYYRKRYAADPEYREKEKARSRENNKRRWRDPEGHARILAYTRKHNAIPEVREKRLAYKREYNKRQYATNPEFREKLLVRKLKRYKRLRQDPEFLEKERARQREYCRKRYATDPEYREKQKESSRFYRACRRSEPLPEYVRTEVFQAFEYEEFDHVQ